MSANVTQTLHHFVYFQLFQNYFKFNFCYHYLKSFLFNLFRAIAGFKFRSWILIEMKNKNWLATNFFVKSLLLNNCLETSIELYVN